jgi:hypothetical protein
LGLESAPEEEEEEVAEEAAVLVPRESYFHTPCSERFRTIFSEQDSLSLQFQMVCLGGLLL